MTKRFLYISSTLIFALSIFGQSLDISFGMYLLVVDFFICVILLSIIKKYVHSLSFINETRMSLLFLILFLIGLNAIIIMDSIQQSHLYIIIFIIGIYLNICFASIFLFKRNS